MKYTTLAIFSSLLLVNTIGCSKSKAPPERSPKEVALADVASISNIGEIGEGTFSNYPKATNGYGSVDLFEQIFGGHDGYAVKGFLDERLKYYFSESEVRSASEVYSAFGKSELAADTDVIELARNLGFGVWLAGLASGTAPYYNIGGYNILFDDPRVGVMLIGPGYLQSSQPIRQATLLHEARHSDCTGGYDKQNIVNFGRSGDVADLKDHACGHTHIKCESGVYSGEYACDDLPWGAYSIGYVYMTAIASKQTDYIQRSDVEAAAADSLDRLIHFSKSAMLRGELGAPDMSSTPYAY